MRGLLTALMFLAGIIPLVSWGAEETTPAAPDYNLHPPADAAACLTDARKYFAEGSYAWALAAADELAKRWPDDNNHEEADYLRILCLERLGYWSDLETALWQYADTYTVSVRSAEIAEVIMALYCARAYDTPDLGYTAYSWESYLERRYSPLPGQDSSPELEERRKAALAYAERVYGALEKATPPGIERTSWVDRRALARYRYEVDRLKRKYPASTANSKKAEGLKRIRRRLARKDLSVDMESALAYVAGGDVLASYQPKEEEWRAAGRPRIEYQDWLFENWLARAREVWGETIAAYGDAVGGRLAKAILAHYDIVYLDEPGRAATAFDELAAAYAGTPGEDVFRKRAQDLRTPALAIVGADMARDGSRRVDVTVAARLIPEVTLTIYAADPSQYLELYRDACDERVPTMALPGLGEPVATKILAARGPAGDLRFNKITASWDDLPYGLYIVDAPAGDAWSRAIFTITDGIAVTANDGDRAYIQIVDAVTSNPLPFKIASAKLIVSEYVQTGGDGRGDRSAYIVKSIESVDVAVEPAPPGSFINSRDYPPNSTLYLNIDTARGPVLMASSVGGDGLPDTALTGAIYTDQPLYRPGATVNYKGILRRVDYMAKKLTPEAGAKVRIDLGAGGRPDADTPAAVDVITDEFGTFAGEYELKAAETLGDKSLTCAWGSDEYKDRAKCEFKVGEYVKPEGGLTCTPGRKRYVSGEEAILNVNGRYLTGEPMAGEVIHYLFTDFYSSPLVLAEGNRVLDADGDARIAVRLPFADRYNRNVSYFVDLPAYPLTKNRTYGDIEVAGADRRLWLRETGTRGYEEYRPHTASEDIPLIANVRDLDGNGAVAEVTWAVYEAAEGFDPRDELGQPLAKGTVITGADGEAAFCFRLADPPERAAVIATTLDTRGRSVTSTAEYINYEPPTAGGTGYLALEVNNDRPAVGAMLTVIITSSLEPGPCVVFAAPDERRLEVWNVLLEPTPTGSRAELAVPVTADLAPGFEIEAFAMRNGYYYEGETFVRPETEATYALAVTCSVDKAAHLPGETVTATVSCADDAGAPMAADISLAAVDEALLALQDDKSRKALEPFKNALGRNRRGVFETSAAARGEIVKVHPRLTYYDVPRDLTAKELLPQADNRQWPAMTLAGEVELDPCPNRNLAQRLLGLLPENNDHYYLRGGYSNLLLARPEKGDIFDYGYHSIAHLGTGGSPGISISGCGGLAVGFGPRPLRTNFADRAFWAAHLRTDEGGIARATFTLPDNLTNWRLTAIAVDRGERFGSAVADFEVRKDIVAALETPTYLVGGDRARVTAFSRNFTGAERQVQLGLAVDGAARVEGAAAGETTVAPGREASLMRYVETGAPGEIELTASAEADVESDAMLRRIPVYTRGVRYRQVFAGRLDDEVRQTLTLPATVDPASFNGEVSFTPSVAALLCQGFPYYRERAGASTEQVLNSFRVNAELAAAAAEIGLSESSLTAGLDDAVRAGWASLTDYSRYRVNGWSWFPGGPASPYMTAYVVDGLWHLQRNPLVALDNKALSQEIWIRRYDLTTWLAMVAAELKDYDAATALYCADVALRTEKQSWQDPRIPEDDRVAIGKIAAACYTRRESMDALSLTPLASVYGQLGDREKLAVVLRNLDNGACAGAEGTIYWGNNTAWRWQDDAVETTAKVLETKLTYEPDDPDIPKIAAWLVDQRRGAAWKSTKDSAAATLALIKYLKTYPEATAPVKIEYRIGAVKETADLNPKDCERPTLKTAYTAADVAADGEFVVRRLGGDSPLFYTVSAEYFAPAADTPATPGSVTLERRYYLAETRIRNGKVVSNRRPLERPIKKGESVEVELRITSPYDFDFVSVVDPKPAGFAYPEGVSRFDPTLNAYVEFGDRERRMLFERLPRGETVATYRVRAAIPGMFVALPASITGVYSPDIGASTAATTLEIRE